jgi:hypothetical protein
MNNYSISAFLNRGELSQLTAQAMRLKKLQLLIQEILPKELAEHCQAISFTNQCLLLEVPNSSIATVLRYHTPTLLAQIRQHQAFASIASIKHQVKPIVTTKSHNKAQKPKIAQHYSQNSRDLIATIADKISYEPLKNALLRLSRSLPK